jgi:hypothetical protein
MMGMVGLFHSPRAYAGVRAREGVGRNHPTISTISTCFGVAK